MVGKKENPNETPDTKDQKLSESEENILNAVSNISDSIENVDRKLHTLGEEDNENHGKNEYKKMRELLHEVINNKNGGWWSKYGQIVAVLGSALLSLVIAFATSYTNTQVQISNFKIRLNSIEEKLDTTIANVREVGSVEYRLSILENKIAKVIKDIEKVEDTASGKRDRINKLKYQLESLRKDVQKIKEKIK